MRTAADRNDSSRESSLSAPRRHDEGETVPGRDTDLLRALHDQHAQALWTYVLGLTGGDRGHAEDVVQETLLRVWRTPDVLDQSQRSARSWLFTVAKRLVIDDWRSARRRREVASATLPERPQADTADQSVTRVLVDDALRRLSLEHRQVLQECHLRGATAAEAALRLGIPTGTVKSRMHYAVKAFRLAFEDLGGLL